MSTGAPDALEPILGWRVWRLSDGLLCPLSAHAAGAWTPGVNEARCHMYSTRHRAPGSNCVCGFNALHHLPDEYRGDPRYVIGTIAAWGEVDVYRTGFRSQFACVLGLLAAAPAGSSQRRAIEAAAERYAVPALEREDLAAHSVRHAREAGPSVLPGGPRVPVGPAGQPLPLGAAAARFEGRGVLVHRHLAVDHRRRLMRVAPTPSLAALAGDRVVAKVGIGEVVAEHQVLFEAQVGESVVAVEAPVDGAVLQINESMPRFEEGPAAAGWLIELRLESESLDNSAIAWDRRGAEVYREYVLAAGSDADLLLGCAEDPRPPEALLDGDEGRAWLREFAQRLDTAIGCDEALAAAMISLGWSVCFEVAGVEAMRIRPPGFGSSRWLSTGPTGSGPEAELRIALGADDLRRYWRGEIGLAPDEVEEMPTAGEAPGSGEPQRAPLRLLNGDRGRLLLALSLHKRLFDRTRSILDQLGHPWFKAGDAVRDPVRNLEVLAGFEPPEGMSGIGGRLSA